MSKAALECLRLDGVRIGFGVGVVRCLLGGPLAQVFRLRSRGRCPIREGAATPRHSDILGDCRSPRRLCTQLGRDLSQDGVCMYSLVRSKNVHDLGLLMTDYRQVLEPNGLTLSRSTNIPSYFTF